MSKGKSLYYESHITIKPVFGEQLEKLKEVAMTHTFKVASLYMRKSEDDSGALSTDDTFCSAKSNDLEDLRGKMLLMLENLQAFGYETIRYKLEAALLDSKIQGDCYGFIK